MHKKDPLKYFAGVILFTMFLLNLIATPFWRITHDTAFVHYIAMLIDKFNYVPYRDIYDTSMPATLILHIFLIGKPFGYTESGLQLFNFLFTIMFLAVNIIYLKRFSIFIRMIVGSYFLLIYQSYGLEMSLQRDFLACFFILLSCILIRDLKKDCIKHILSGVSLGIAFCIKPQFGIGLPVIYFIGEKTIDLAISKKRLTTLSIYILGFTIPIILSFMWLWKTGAWNDFWFMQKSYLPQYIQLDSNHEFIESKLSSTLINIKNYLYKVPYWRLSFFVFVFGSLLCLKYDKMNKRFWAFNFILGVLYSCTLMVSGQYFPYHFMSFFLFAFFPLAGFFLKSLPERLKTLSSFALTLIILNNVAQFPIETITWVKGDKPFITKGGRVDRLVSAIDKIRKEDETIQLFDWVEGGVAHALMNLNITHRYRFITDHIFKHHLHLEAKKDLNTKYLNQLKSGPPNLIIKSLKHNYPKGRFTTKDLPQEYLNFIDKNYKIVFTDPDFLIYRLTI